MINENTIAAIATPYGEGGVAMIRISGKDAFVIASKLFRPIDEKKVVVNMKGYTSAFGRIFDQEGDIDECILASFKSPRSYTGEDVIELTCHGGKYIAQKVLRTALQQGATLASAGEFTKRAFLNGKLTLTQAEAVIDLISAGTKQAAQVALATKDGKLACKIVDIANDLVNSAAHIAAWIDYPEEDVELVLQENLLTELNIAQMQLNELLESYDTGKILREGIDTVIIGNPNVGKSTLMNLLTGYNRSIVTNIAGTTRDIIEESIQLGEIKLNIADTAGLRESDDLVEQIGVQMAQEKIEKSNVILLVLDGTQAFSTKDKQLVEKLRDKNLIVIINKSDLTKNLDKTYLENTVKYIVSMSAKEGDGYEELTRIVTEISKLTNFDSNIPMLHNERQRMCVTQAHSCITQAIESLNSNVTLDAVSVCIEEAIDYLFTLSGKKASEQVIEQVFEQFCVGK